MEALYDELRPVMPGTVVVLGTTCQGAMSVRQQFQRQRVPSGSGALCMAVHAEGGHTRVLVASDAAISLLEIRKKKDYSQDFSVKFDLQAGLGLSVVGLELSELIYLRLGSILVCFNFMSPSLLPWF